MLQGQRMMTKWRADYLILHVFITSALPFASFVHLKKEKTIYVQFVVIYSPTRRR